MTVPVALVTGAAHGIGFATSALLAERGYSVHLVDVDAEAGAAAAARLVALGADAQFHCADLRDDDAVARVVREAAGSHAGRLDVVVNSAFRYERSDTILTRTPAQWDDDLQLLLLSYVTVVREAAPLLGAGGAVVNLTSVRASFTGRGFGAYSIAKAAIVQLTRTLAYELGPRGIRVNAVAPGIVVTDRNSEWILPKEDRFRAITPLGRVGTPDDVARAVCFLASAEAAFVTGVVLVVDGGLTLPLQVDSVAAAGE
jgi:NAD(P)-dependent dehydrogenase (short-subunit alcohol dehydrogenase family)